MLSIPAQQSEMRHYESGDAFLEGLKSYDPCLEAYRSGDKIIVWANRQGLRVLEHSAERPFGYLWPEFERLILKELPKKDVWKRFKDGKAYDDYLHEQATKAKEEKLRKNKEERLALARDEKHLWAAAVENAKEGRFTKERAKPYKIPTITVSRSLKGDD